MDPMPAWQRPRGDREALRRLLQTYGMEVPCESEAGAATTSGASASRGSAANSWGGDVAAGQGGAGREVEEAAAKQRAAEAAAAAAAQAAEAKRQEAARREEARRQAAARKEAARQEAARREAARQELAVARETPGQVLLRTYNTAVAQARPLRREDHSSYLQQYEQDIWDFFSVSPRAGLAMRTQGLQNLERQNLCFMNAVMQALLRIPALAAWCVHHRSECDAPSSAHTSSRTSRAKKLLKR